MRAEVETFGMYLYLTTALLGITSISISQINTFQRKLYTPDSSSFHLIY
jgi:hypothetical protein